MYYPKARDNIMFVIFAAASIGEWSIRSFSAIPATMIRDILTCIYQIFYVNCVMNISFFFLTNVDIYVCGKLLNAYIHHIKKFVFDPFKLSAHMLSQEGY